MSGTPPDSTTLLIRDFILPAFIGIYPHEKAAPQRLRVEVEMALAIGPPVADDIAHTVSYEGAVEEIRRLARRHHDLVETFAGNLADFCLADPRVARVRVKVEKPDVFPEGAVGVAILRHRRED